jgi:aminoglycoside phosphotransferase (APT) family kinase protein
MNANPPYSIAGWMGGDRMGKWRETVAPVNRQDLDRVAAVISRLKDTAKALETLHDVDQAAAHLEKVISEDFEPLKALKK